MIIRAVASALPLRCYNSAEIASWCGSDEHFLREKVGIASRHFLDEEESELDLAVAACEKLFAQTSFCTRERIRLCIYVGQARTQVIPHTSALLQYRLGLPQNCACFDLGLACSGYIYALVVAKSLMEGIRINDALLITCDPYSKIMKKNDRDTMPLFGDAATASWLSLEGSGLEIGQTDLGTDGSGASYLEYSVHGNNSGLYMDGKGIFNFALRRVPESIQHCLILNTKTKDEIDYFFFHQANAFIIRMLCSLLTLPAEKCPVRMENVANTVSSSIPLLLEEFLPCFHAGEQVIMSGFGGGLSWGTAYAKYKGEYND